MRGHLEEMRGRRRRELRRLRDAALARRVREQRHRLEDGGCGKAIPA
jgi:hypothetical protein